METYITLVFFLIASMLMLSSFPIYGVYGARVIFQEELYGEETTDVISESVRMLQTPPIKRLDASHKSDFLDAHNEARAAVGVDALQWDATHASEAEKALRAYFPQACLINSGGGGSYGENIFCGIDSSSPPRWTPRSAVNDWVLEKQNYNYATNSCNPPGAVCDQYKQVVNAATTKVGCAMGIEKSKMLVVCKYTKKATGEKPY